MVDAATITNTLLIISVNYLKKKKKQESETQTILHYMFVKGFRHL